MVLRVAVHPAHQPSANHRRMGFGPTSRLSVGSSDHVRFSLIIILPVAHIFTFRTASSFKIIATVVTLYINWEIITPRVAPGTPNPFAPLIFISHPIESSPPHDPRYAKGYLDLVFVASYIVFFSFLRQIFILHVFRPLARWYGIKKSKFDRFGEQGYAVVYWGAMSVWGYVSSFLHT